MEPWLKRSSAAFLNVRATGKVTPSGSEPGKKTPKPGPDLVGKVCEVWSPLES